MKSHSPKILKAFLSSEKIERNYDAFVNRFKHGGSQNTNYIKGRSWEYAGIKKFRSHGFVVLRSFGSLGAFDYLAFRHGICYLVQAKWSSQLDTTPRGHDLAKLVALAVDSGGIATFQGIAKRGKLRGAMVFYCWKGTAWEEFNPFHTEERLK